MNDFDFIRNFGKIKISDCCKICGVQQSNLYLGKTSKEKAKQVREELEDKIGRLFLKG
jgi:uncharacterized metal-binding protein